MRAQAEGPSALRADTPPSAVAAGFIAAGQVECWYNLFATERVSPSAREPALAGFRLRRGPGGVTSPLSRRVAYAASLREPDHPPGSVVSRDKPSAGETVRGMPRLTGGDSSRHFRPS